MKAIQVMLGALVALLSAAAFAAVDVNKANQAELESIKGIGVASSTRILDERTKAPFKNWGDLVERVRGIGPNNAAKFSTQGMTVNGAAYASNAGTAESAKPRAGAKQAAQSAAAAPAPAGKKAMP